MSVSRAATGAHHRVDTVDSYPPSFRLHRFRAPCQHVLALRSRPLVDLEATLRPSLPRATNTNPLPAVTPVRTLDATPATSAAAQVPINVHSRTSNPAVCNCNRECGARASTKHRRSFGVLASLPVLAQLRSTTPICVVSAAARG